MSNQSDRVKLWRRNCKERIIAAMGGKCCVCSYNKCQSALALHHLDPSQKDIGLGKIRANPQSWNTIVKELRKCILVCHVCHCEIHEEIINVPVDAPKFDESFVDYKSLEVNNSLLSPCPVCEKLKPLHLKTCSLSCSGKAKYRVAWDTIDLVKELKTKSIATLAEELSCSDAAIHKRLKKLGLK